MAALRSSGLSVGAKKAMLPSFEGLRHSPSAFQASLRVRTCDIGQQQRCFHGLIVKAATIVAPKILKITIFVMPYI
ncbi:putative groES chaperonin family [Dioscorea sansibarensis]